MPQLKLLVLVVCLHAVFGCETPEIECAVECEAGFRVAGDGCAVCECADPALGSCENVYCGSDKNLVCKVFNMTSGGRVSRCVDQYIPTRCQMPKDHGPCDGVEARYWFDANTNECKEFIYGGCQGNRNKFKTLMRCIYTCIPMDADDDNRKTKVAPALTSACSNMGCYMECEHGFRLDEDECPLCECRTLEEYIATCGAVECTLECEYGMKQDSRGCRTCECSPAPQQSGCGEKATCLMECAGGFQIDENGCEICACLPEKHSDALCSDIECFMECPNGQKLDTQGCKMCECIDADSADESFEDEQLDHLDPSLDEPKAACGPFMCLMECENGFKSDDKGCDVCECDDSHACAVNPALQCMMECEYGFKSDDKGCELCECATRDETCGAFECFKNCEHGFARDEKNCPVCLCDALERSDQACPPVQCSMYCEHGFMSDSDGCVTCNCIMLTDACPPVHCKMECEHGFVQDSRGCETCTCRDKPAGACDRPTCLMECEFGFKSDYDGCDICECADDPCEDVTCPKQYVCASSSQPGLSQFEPGKCVSIFTQRAWCLARPSCLNHCEHGKVARADGCDTCTCRDGPAGPCQLMAECPNHCQYGLSFSQDGCQQCQCLEDPCESHSCSSDQVCEALQYEDCEDCPHQAVCIDDVNVRRVHIKLKYVTNTHYTFIQPSFANGNLTRMLKDQLVSEFKVEPFHVRISETVFDRKKDLSETYVTLRFDMVGDENDLVALAKTFKTRILDYSLPRMNVSLQSGETAVLTPLPESFKMTYHSSLPSSDTQDEEPQTSVGSTASYIIIAVLGSLLVLLIILALVLRARSKSENGPTYTKAPTNP